MIKQMAIFHSKGGYKKLNWFLYQSCWKLQPYPSILSIFSLALFKFLLSVANVDI